MNPIEMRKNIWPSALSAGASFTRLGIPSDSVTVSYPSIFYTDSVPLPISAGFLALHSFLKCEM